MDGQNAISQGSKHRVALRLRGLRDTWGSIPRAGGSAGDAQANHQVSSRGRVTVTGSSWPLGGAGLALSASTFLLPGFAGSARPGSRGRTGRVHDPQPTGSSRRRHGADESTYHVRGCSVCPWAPGDLALQGPCSAPVSRQGPWVPGEACPGQPGPGCCVRGWGPRSPARWWGQALLRPREPGLVVGGVSAVTSS